MNKTGRAGGPATTPEDGPRREAARAFHVSVRCTAAPFRSPVTARDSATNTQQYQPSPRHYPLLAGSNRTPWSLPPPPERSQITISSTRGHSTPVAVHQRWGQREKDEKPARKIEAFFGGGRCVLIPPPAPAAHASSAVRQRCPGGHPTPLGVHAPRLLRVAPGVGSCRRTDARLEA